MAEDVHVTRRVRVVARDAVSAADLLVALGDPTRAARMDRSVGLSELFAEARHQADFACHPYVDQTHVLLAAARLACDEHRWRSLRAELVAPWTVGEMHWWRPRGRRSAARATGLERLRRDHVVAMELEKGRGWQTHPIKSQTHH